MRFTLQQKLIPTLVAVWLVAATPFIRGDDEITIVTVALTDLDAPGIPGAINYDSFSDHPVINDAGDVVFEAFVQGAPVDAGNDFAVFSGQPGSLDLVLREGDQVPGFGAGVTFGQYLWQPLIDRNGHSTFITSIEGTGIVEHENDYGLFSDASGDPELVILNGELAPGIGAGAKINYIHTYSKGENGDVAFVAILEGAGIHTGNEHAVYKYSNGTFELIAQKGEFVPGFPGADYTNLLAGIRINGAGQTTFRPIFHPPGAFGIFQYSDGVMESFAITGEQAPGAPAGVTFESMSSASFDQNEFGQIAVKTYLDDGGSTKFGVFSNSTGSLQRIAMTGQIAPGTEPGTVFDNFGPAPVINNNGDTAFIALLSGPNVDDSNYLAVYAQTNGVLRLVARQGEVAPETQGRIFVSFGKPYFSDTGQIVIHAVIDGFSVGNHNNEIIYLGNADQLHLVAREGRLFDVDDDPAFDDLRTVESLQYADGVISGTGPAVSLNDAGQLVFRLSFTDGTEGLFIANTPLLLGDVNGDGNVDLLDVLPFVNALSAGVYIPAADVNQDGVFNLLDVGPFVDLLAS